MKVDWYRAELYWGNIHSYPFIQEAFEKIFYLPLQVSPCIWLLEEFWVVIRQTYWCPQMDHKDFLVLISWQGRGELCLIPLNFMNIKTSHMAWSTEIYSTTSVDNEISSMTNYLITQFAFEYPDFSIILINVLDSPPIKNNGLIFLLHLTWRRYIT